MNPNVYVLASILLVTTSQFLFKHGVTVVSKRERPEGTPLWRHYLNMALQPHIFSGLALNGFAAVFWLLALSKLELSFIFPFLSMNYILIPLGASVLLTESLTMPRKIGIGVICLGIFLVALS